MKSAAPLRYGIIGFGGIAETRIAREGFALGPDTPTEADPRFTLTAATSRSERRRAAAEALGLTWYASAEALLADPGIDAVFIASDNATHARFTAAALDAGKHVIVEKPMTAVPEEAARLVAQARAAGLVLSVNHMMKQLHCNRQARVLVMERKLGEVNDAVFHMEFDFGRTPEQAKSWRCADPAQLGGPVGDVGSHCIYTAEFILGCRIAEVAAVFTPHCIPIAAENGAMIRCFADNGLEFTIRVSFADRRGGMAGGLTGNGYEIYGGEAVLRGVGTLAQGSGHPGEPIPPRLEFESLTERRDIDCGAPENIYQAVIRRHAEAVLTGTAGDCEEAVHNLAVIRAALASCRSNGEKVRV